MSAKRFNIRAYGIWIRNGSILINEELVNGRNIVKFPGGGLDWGEGIIDCLKREWLEELGIEIEVLDHFYTTDFFQHSAFDDSQVISIYYLVSAVDAASEIVNQNDGERTFWLDLQKVSAEIFTLPIDKKVGQMLEILYNRKEL